MIFVLVLLKTSVDFTLLIVISKVTYFKRNVTFCRDSFLRFNDKIDVLPSISNGKRTKTNSDAKCDRKFLKTLNYLSRVSRFTFTICVGTHTISALTEIETFRLKIMTL